MRLHVGHSHHEAIGTGLVSIRVDSTKNRGGSLTMENDTVAESVCRAPQRARLPLSLAAPRPSCRHKIEAQESGLDPTRLISDGQSGTGIEEILSLPIVTGLPLGSAVEVPLELACGQSRQCVDSIESFGMEGRDRPWHWL